MDYADKVPVIKNWLGNHGLQFWEVHIQVEEEVSTTADGLFGSLNSIFRPEHNRTILSLLNYNIKN